VIGVALLGGGFMARIHASSYASLTDRARVRVLCALEGGDALAEDLGAELSRDWEEAIAAPGVDAVDICLPTPLHRQVAERALELGRHVLVEKPLALTLEDADAIGAAAAAAGRVLMVGHVLRYFPEVVELRRLLESGELGAARAVSARRLSAPPGWNEWMLDPTRSGGVLVDMMIHDFDIALAVLGEARRVRAVSAAAGRHVNALVEHEHGDAAIEGSHAMPPSYPFTAALRVLCDGGVLEHGFVTGAGDEVADAQAASVLAIHPRDGDARRFHEAVDPWAAQLAHFLECVADGGEPRDGSFAQARAALALALAARRSIETGEIVAVAQ
jgi:predicted dehydrogenase